MLGICTGVGNRHSYRDPILHSTLVLYNDLRLSMKLSLPGKITVFSLLCLLTLLAHFTVERYCEVGEQLLQNNDFAAGLET
jgi:hypothetical protein